MNLNDIPATTHAEMKKIYVRASKELLNDIDKIIEFQVHFGAIYRVHIDFLTKIRHNLESLIQLLEMEPQ